MSCRTSAQWAAWEARLVPYQCQACRTCLRDPDPVENPGRRCIYGGPFVYSNTKED